MWKITFSKKILHFILRCVYVLCAYDINNFPRHLIHSRRFQVSQTISNFQFLGWIYRYQVAVVHTTSHISWNFSTSQNIAKLSHNILKSCIDNFVYFVIYLTSIFTGSIQPASFLNRVWWYNNKLAKPGKQNLQISNSWNFIFLVTFNSNKSKIWCSRTYQYIGRKGW